MAQDSAGRTIVSAGYNGNYEVVDMNFNDDTKVIQINQLNGRQGDTRTARIKTVQDNQNGTGTVAYSIDGLQPQIVGKDAKGNTIQIAGNWNPINVNLGLFSITAPANVYQAVGLTQGCYLRLVDSGGNVVSSIPVIFEVIQDSSNMTNYEATAFLQSVDAVAQQANEKFDSSTALAQTAKDIANQALSSAQETAQTIENDKVALLNETNNFTADQSIEGVSFKDVVNRLATVEGNVLSDTGEVPLALSSDFTGNLRCRKITLKNPDLTLYIMSGQVTNSKALTAYNWVNLSEQKSSIIPEWDYMSARTDGGVSMTSAFNGSAFIINTGLDVPAGTNIQWNTISV